MSYLALYREWRPRTFGEIVGQKHVSRTLMNALKTDRVAHAYLFSGPRGTGKTTMAKILAKALNCEEREGVEPCNHCPSCVSIDQGSAMEVMEIDAASNRGIDEIRDLRDKVKLVAAKGKHKVYIIDEVHMLTMEAFNALLKTLEEPPERVIFVLATTEAHKIPLTILSRVQRFEFQRIPTGAIQTRLAQVCEAIGRQDVEAEALRVIARKAEGGLRDALSILDQCLIQDGPLEPEAVYQVLGMVGESFSADLLEMLLAADYGRALERLGEGIDSGRDPRQIIRELLDYLRQVLLYESAQQAPSVAPHLQERLMQQSREAGLDRVLAWIGVLLQGEGELRYAGNPRLAAELLLVKAIHARTEGEAKNVSSDKAQQKSAAKPLVKALPSSVAVPRTGLIMPTETGLKIESESITDPKAGAAVLALGDIESNWPRVLEMVRERKRSTHAFLLEGRPFALAGDVLTLVFKAGYSFHRDKVEQVENRGTVEAALASVFQVPLKLKTLMEADLQEGNPSPGEEEIVQKAVAMFGADLVVVKD